MAVMLPDGRIRYGPARIGQVRIGQVRFVQSFNAPMLRIDPQYLFFSSRGESPLEIYFASLNYSHFVLLRPVTFATMEDPVPSSRRRLDDPHHQGRPQILASR